MIGDDPSGSANLDGSGPSAATFTAAIGDVVQFTLSLSSATTTLAFAEAVRVRSELERALLHARSLAEQVAESSDQGEALRQLSDMESVAKRALAIAPALSVAAIQAAEAGDPTAWLAEERAWMSLRCANGASATSRRSRRMTPPERPYALRISEDSRVVAEPWPAPPTTSLEGRR